MPIRQLAICSKLLSFEIFYRADRFTLALLELDDTYGKSVVQEDVEEGAVNFQYAVIFNEARLPELI